MHTIKQAPTTYEKLGNKIRRFEQTSSTYEMSFDPNRKLWRHGLKNEDEIKKVEDYYGRSFSDREDDEFWGQLTFTLKHDIEPIESLDNPPDLLKVRVFKAQNILGDVHDVVNGDTYADFIISNVEAETEIKASLYEKRDEAIARLIILKKSLKYCKAIAKYLLPQTMKITTLNEAYTKLREYIDGKILKGKGDAINNFNAAYELDKELLYVTVDFNEALHKNIIRKNASNKFFNPMTGTELGKNGTEAISFLMNPSNQDELGGGKEEKPYSIRYQLKNK